GKPHANPGAPLPLNLFICVAQLNRATMFLGDAPDDSKSKTSSFLSSRDIGLKQPVTICLWQTNAVIYDINHNIVAITRGEHADHSRTELPRRHRGNSFGRILDNVGKSM